MEDQQPLVYSMAQWSIKIDDGKYHISPTSFFEKPPMEQALQTPQQATAAIVRYIQREFTFDEFSEGNDRLESAILAASSLMVMRSFGESTATSGELKYGSEDPADPFKTCRVLTIMRAEDY